MNKLLTLILLASSIVRSKSWIEVSGDYECPDLLIFSGSEYEVINDCYGINPRKPVIDSGSFEIKDGYFIFTDRKNEHSSFFGSGATGKFEIILKTENELHIRVGDIIHEFQAHPLNK